MPPHSDPSPVAERRRHHPRGSSALAALALALLAHAVPAAAQSQAPAQRGAAVDGFGLVREPGPLGPDWQLTLGVVGGVRPDYLGSNSYEFTALPLVELLWNNRVFATTRGGGPEIGVFLNQDPRFRFGVGIDYAFGRDQDDNSRLGGLGDIDGTPRGRVFSSSRFGAFTLSGFLTQDLGNNGHGLLVGGDLEYRARVSDSLSLFAGPGLTIADDEYMGTYFGVTAAQASRSTARLPRYDASAGVRDVRLSLGAVYAATRQIVVLPRVTVAQLLGDAADSPITRSETQVVATVGLAWRF